LDKISIKDKTITKDNNNHQKKIKMLMNNKIKLKKILKILKIKKKTKNDEI